jgi:uncharacterized protein DUF4157/putative RNase toxin 15 of polymorphic toxin system
MPASATAAPKPAAKPRNGHASPTPAKPTHALKPKPAAVPEHAKPAALPAFARPVPAQTSKVSPVVAEKAAPAAGGAAPKPAPFIPAAAAPVRPAVPKAPSTPKSPGAAASKPHPKLAPLASPKTPSVGGGQPLPAHVQEAIQNSLMVDLSSVRLHASTAAQRKAQSLSARAFTFGNDIFLGHGEHPTDLTLISHEAAHVIQQQAGAHVQAWSSDHSDRYEREANQAAAAVQRSETFAVRERVSSPRVQRLGISDALDYLADAAYNIPGYRMFTVILGVNPINMEHVERSPANILRAAVEFIPGGHLITTALDRYGVFDKVGSWVQDQLDTLAITGSAIKKALMDFLDSLSWRDIFHLGDVWDRAKRIFTDPIDRIKNFLVGLLEGIWKFVREAILKPIAKLAEGRPGWDLLIAVLGKNPITGEPVPRTPETLIGGFMKLIHEEEVWNNIKKANAIPRAWAWFQSVLSGLLGFVTQIPGLFVQALKSLDWTDIIDLPAGFMKIVGIFGKFVIDFGSWAAEKVWNLLQIIFEIVAPSVMPYLTKLGAAFRGILKNPIGFVRNLVAAGKLGFNLFKEHIGVHLKASFIDWLTKSLQGVYLPKSLDLQEIIKFVLSVLGISWANIRAKLVKVVGETAVKAMETGFDIVVTLVKEGPAAAWDKIKEQLANLKDMVMNPIMEYVIETVVKKAVAKVLSLLIPGGAFIQAIISIYDTIVVFVDKLAKIIEVVKAFLDSMMQIASGAITAAAAKVENTLSGMLTLAISFLAGFLGLGKIADKVMDIINTKIRAPIDKALDAVINWIVTMAKKLGRFVVQAGVPQDPNERLELGMRAAVSTVDRFAGKKVGATVLTPLLGAIKVRYGFKVLELVSQAANWAIHGQVNPETIAFTRVIVGTDKDTGVLTTATIVEPAKVLVFEFRRFTANQTVSINEMTEGLQHHQNALNDLTVAQWLANVYFRPFLKGATAAEERDIGRRDLLRELRSEIVAEYAKKNVVLSKGDLDLLVRLRARQKHASHLADFAAGGNIDEFDSLERGAVNSYVGSNWGRFRPELEAYAIHLRQAFDPKDREKVKMNFRLRIKFLG